MQTIKIGGNVYKEEVDNLVKRYFPNSKTKIEVENFKNRYEFIFFPGKKRNQGEFELYNIISKLIRDIILRIYSKEIIRDRVNKVCTDYSTSEKEEIENTTHSVLNNEESFHKEKEMIYEEILNYLIENNFILIDGFIRFRLSRFLYAIDISIEKAIGQLEVEKEYEEFINMLQYFVDIQEPKYELIHVIIKDDDYYLLDKDNKIIENSSLEQMPTDPIYEGISKADLLVSSLIILAPLKVIVHIEEDKEEDIISIIKQVFEDKVEICHACDICDLEIKIHKGK